MGDIFLAEEEVFSRPGEGWGPGPGRCLASGHANQALQLETVWNDDLATPQEELSWFNMV